MLLNIQNMWGTIFSQSHLIQKNILLSQGNLSSNAEWTPEVSVVFFDFDKTLTTRDTLLPFAFHVCRKTKRLASFLTLIFCYMLLRLKLISNKDFKSLFLRFVINGITQEDLKDIVSEFENSFIKNHLNRPVFDKFREYIESGCKVVIVSSNFDILLENLSMINKALIISTQTDYKDKRYYIKGDVCAGEEKLKKIEAIFGKRIFEEAIFYGDKEDKILLRAFKTSIEV